MSELNIKQVCGIVMPISAIDGCLESHWADVLEIFSESIEQAGFEPNLVSNADDVGIIHKRIIQNLYENPIVICDVSGKNPNVMFELGLRLAFDKPTVIVKDEKTPYSFDTSAIEHLEYPRDLRFSRIVDFKQKLAEKISATYKKSVSDPEYSTFLKHFGEFKVAKLETKEVSGQEFILDELRGLRSSMRRLESGPVSRDFDEQHFRPDRMKVDFNICLEKMSDSRISEMLQEAVQHPDILSAEIDVLQPNHKHLIINAKPGANMPALEALFGRRSRMRSNLRPNLKRIDQH
jgi:hypothetical protein